MNECSGELDAYLECIKKYDHSFVRNHMCKTVLTHYNNCVLGKPSAPGSTTVLSEEQKNQAKILAENLRAQNERALSDYPPYVN